MRKTGWAFLPRWRWTARLVLSGVWSALLSILYLVLAILYMPGAEGGFGSLAEVRTLFQSDALLLAGWVHYLAFDLFIGAWEVRDAWRLNIPHVLVVPCLILTFLLGPAGLLAYFIVRLAVVRKLPGRE